MNTRQLARAIAQRLPGRSQDQVQEVLTVLVEIAEQELSKPRAYIYVQGLGRLHVDCHPLKPAGALQGRYGQGTTLARIYLRFTPSKNLKETIRRTLENTESPK